MSTPSRSGTTEAPSGGSERGLSPGGTDPAIRDGSPKRVPAAGEKESCYRMADADIECLLLIWSLPDRVPHPDLDHLDPVLRQKSGRTHAATPRALATNQWVLRGTAGQAVGPASRDGGWSAWDGLAPEGWIVVNRCAQGAGGRPVGSLDQPTQNPSDRVLFELPSTPPISFPAGSSLLDLQGVSG